MADIIQIRRDTAANWTGVDPTLANGEIGYESDTYKFKVGDGSTAWTLLSYWTGTDNNAIHDNVANEITGITNKGSVAANDELVIEDSGASYVKKAILFSILEGALTHNNLSGIDDGDINHLTDTQVSALHTATVAGDLNLNDLAEKSHDNLDDASEDDHHGKQHAMDSATYHTSTDITTLNATTSKHGFLKKLDNEATNFMNGQGDWAEAGGEISIVVGTYTGDGAGNPSDWIAFKSITGVGFRPKFVYINPNLNIQSNTPSGNLVIDVGFTDITHRHVDRNTSGGGHQTVAYSARITADGFDVADINADVDPNKNGTSYKYICIG